MKTDDESIKTLKLRIQRQLNLPLEKDIELQNIQRYVSSAMMQKEKQLQNERIDDTNTLYQTVYEKLQIGQRLTKEEREILQQTDPASYHKAISIETESDVYRQKLHNCRTKEEVKRTQEYYQRLKRLGLSLSENSAAIPVGRKMEHTLFKDAKISAIKNITKQFIESGEYEKLPDDAAYLQQTGENPPAIEYMEIPETVMTQHVRGKKEYKRILHTANGEDSFENKPFISFNG